MKKTKSLLLFCQFAAKSFFQTLIMLLIKRNCRKLLQKYILINSMNGRTLRISLELYQGWTSRSKETGIIIFYCRIGTLRLCSIPVSCLRHVLKVHGKYGKGSNGNVDLSYESLDTGLNSFIRVKTPFYVFSTRWNSFVIFRKLSFMEAISLK